MNRFQIHIIAFTILMAFAVILPGSGDALAQSAGQVPGGSLGNSSDAEFWRGIRAGEGNLIQADGSSWRALRNGPLSTYGIWSIAGMLILLAAFYLYRGRIKIEHGAAGTTIERFNLIERFGHWLTAGSFVILAISGLNVLYGRYVLIPVIGKDAFSAITIVMKWLHNWVAFAFMAGLVIIFVMWVVHNIPNRHDIKWLLQAGGLFSKGVHPPAKKFNAGQKVIFWVTVLGGLSLSMSGWALLNPFTTTMFADTFTLLNMVGFSLPTDLTLMQEQQYAQLWHAIFSMFMIAVILAHIYIGSLGMEGAFDAMGSGQVDLNWAKEHHSLWVEEVQSNQTPPEQGDSDQVPAE